MMGQDAQIIDFNRELVRFMRDNPGAYVSIKGNQCAQLMFAEDVNDEKHVAIMEEVQLSIEV